ncbi:MAG: electron transfer flavoprotein subunit alpha/FixB family protein [Solirubrobacterales bacterium]|nr:electron transfer flavoprotein subunit alpha/FixB family protein [Solirubrobacterales bacterium]
MSGVLVVAEHRQGEVRPITYELITAALKLKEDGAGPVAVLVVGGDDSVAGAVGPSGVDAVVTIDSPTAEFEPHLTERAVAAAIEARQPAVVLTGHTVDGFGFAPAVAAANDFGFASNIVAVEANDELTAKRGVYGDRLLAELSFERTPAVLMVRPGASQPADPGGEAPVESLDADLGQSPSEHLAYRSLREGDDEVDITQSEFLLSIGRGIGDEENVERFQELAEKLGATLTASRPLVDAGWLPPARQVGQSGRTVKPKVYLALGISGAIQHLAGIRDAETVIAVNTDPAAPIFDVADYGASLDVHDLAEALEARL